MKPTKQLKESLHDKFYISLGSGTPEGCKEANFHHLREASML